MNNKYWLVYLKYFLTILFFIPGFCDAGAPVWTFTALTATTLSVPSDASAIVQYQITNQSSRSHTLVMKSILGITQLTAGVGLCANAFTLPSKGSSCILSLQIDGAQLTHPILGGPIVCQQGSANQCYQPNQANILNITRKPSEPVEAMIDVYNSPLTLSPNGAPGILSVINYSSTVTATNITSNFTGTALQGNVVETGNTCAVLPPSTLCSLTFTPGANLVPLTAFPIQGSNTNTVMASIAITDPSPILTSVNPNSGATSGGTGVILSGNNFMGTTSVTFGGIPATSVNVMDSNTVTAITPAHAAGAVDVEITTTQGSDTLVNGYTYTVTAVGQAAFGGIIACINGGFDDLIASVTDVSIGIEWGGSGILTNATDNSNGDLNTSTIISIIGNNGGIPYAAQICDEYEIDSQGNSPCEAGNTCYNDWFLPALTQLDCLYTNRVAIGGFSASGYWTSVESNATAAWLQDFASGSQNTASKNSVYFVRCTRQFTP